MGWDLDVSADDLSLFTTDAEEALEAIEKICSDSSRFPTTRRFSKSYSARLTR